MYVKKAAEKTFIRKIHSYNVDETWSLLKRLAFFETAGAVTKLAQAQNQTTVIKLTKWHTVYAKKYMMQAEMSNADQRGE